MKLLLRSFPCLLAISAIGAVAPAQAHFKLIKPTSWIVEGSTGDPQKAAPCGPEGSSGMMTNEITTVTAGETIMVEYDETIHHPGWFRISLAEDRSEFEDITFPNANCTYDMSTVSEEPHGNVLADGLAKDENVNGENRSFKQMITIPNKPCEKCTLQVIQVMADAIHFPPGCIYYHCADLKIVASEGGAAGAPAASGGAGAAGAAGAAVSGGAGASAAGASATAAAGSTGSAGTGATATAAAGGGGAGAAAKPATTTTTTTTAPSTSSGSAGSGARPSTSTTASAGSAGKAGTASTASGTAGASSTSTGTMTAAATAEPKAEEGGCSVSHPGSRSGFASAALLSVMGLLFGARRRRHARA